MQNFTMTSTVIYEGNLRTNATHLRSNTTIETDAPVDNNGKGERFSPTDIVATALASCMQTIMGMKAPDLGVNIDGIKTDVEKIMGTDPRRIVGINLTFHFPETVVADEKQRTILERAALTCPVFKSLHPEIVINTVFNW